MIVFSSYTLLSPEKASIVITTSQLKFIIIGSFLREPTFRKSWYCGLYFGNSFSLPAYQFIYYLP